MFFGSDHLGRRLGDTFLSARYILNHWADSYQTCTDILLGLDDELACFGDLDLISYT